MATVVMQRDLSVALKKETASNVDILSKLQPMPVELTRMIFKENALEKPTQNVFNNLSYYLISLIDANVCASLTWPLYDTKAEKAFRNDVARFISDYSNKGLLSPVMSSYLVNPGCYKVTLLMFQLSQLAVNQMLMTVLKENKKKIYVEMTEKYKSQQNEGFVECIEKETHLLRTTMRSKFSNYLYKRKVVEEIAARFRKKITEMENKLVMCNAQNYINNLVDGFLRAHDVDKETEIELLRIKNVHEQSKIFDAWLRYVDDTISSLEDTWNTKVSPLLESCKTLHQSTKSVISRHTGESDRSTYTVEYNHKTDNICTKVLQSQVNSEQKYVLCNLTKDGQLSFPNLIRAFVISICFILKHTEIGDEIYSFNEYLEGGRRKYSDIVSAMKILIEKIQNAEDRLKPTIIQYHYSLSVKDLPDIPPLPDLTNLKVTRDSSQVLFDTFTPLHLKRYQFNLRKKHSSTLFAKPQLRSVITPFHIAPRDDFLHKSVISCRVSKYDQQKTNCHNLSLISHVNRANETIAECSSGFTKQQILRLLSTKKSSSLKKFKYSTERPSINVKKGLFNESISDESKGLLRSYSSPNLFENKEQRYHTRTKGRKLSIMQENSPMSILEMSGIIEINRDMYLTSPSDYGHAESSRKNLDTSSMPIITVSVSAEKRVKSFTRELNLDKEMGIDSIISPIQDEPRKSINHEEISEVRDETPKTNSRLIRKTSSLEKIINRYKKVRANVLSDKKEELTDFKTIAEEKENTKHVNFDVFTANRNLLPDLLNPSCNSSLSRKQNDNTMDYLDEACLELDKGVSINPRQSLGTVLDIDQNFLDQLDLID